MRNCCNNYNKCRSYTFNHDDYLFYNDELFEEPNNYENLGPCDCHDVNYDRPCDCKKPCKRKSCCNCNCRCECQALLARDHARVKNPASVIARASAIAIVNVKGSVRGKNVASINVIANVSVLLAKDRANANVIVRDAAYVYVFRTFRCADKPAFVFSYAPVTVNVIYPNDCISILQKRTAF